MDGLTPRQQEILDFIRGFVESEGMPPTRAELARAYRDSKCSSHPTKFTHPVTRWMHWWQ